jgi:hypothetical protein
MAEVQQDLWFVVDQTEAHPEAWPTSGPSPHPLPDKVLESLADYDRRNTGGAGRDAQQQEALGVQSPPKLTKQQHTAPGDGL